MPKIQIPEDFVIELDEDEQQPAAPPVFAFVKHFVNRTLLRDSRYWGQSVEHTMTAMEIRTAFKGRGPGDQVEVTEDQWRKLCENVSRPTEPYNVIVMINGKSFFDAILKPAVS